MGCNFCKSFFFEVLQSVITIIQLSFKILTGEYGKAQFILTIFVKGRFFSEGDGEIFQFVQLPIM